MKINKLAKKSMAVFALFAFTVSSFGVSGFLSANVARAATTWDVSGSYVINMDYLGTSNLHDMSLVQDISDNLTGNGGSPAGLNTYLWVINSGTVVNDSINFTANYTATPDAVTPQTVLTVAGVIALDGTMSGTWSDNFNGGERSGTWVSTSGVAVLKTVEPVVTTNPATAITTTDATLNGTNGATAASGHSFWASTTSYTVSADASPSTTPVGVESGTGSLGPIAANTAFSAMLSSTPITITPDTTYYFNAWVLVDTIWYPGEVLSFTTNTLNGEVVPGDGTLEVTSIDVTDSTATADGTFENGWEYVFNVTVPSDEPNVAMKFADWLRDGGGGTIPAANNIRISSAQADNGGATIMITAANVYSADLHMTGDTDLLADGMQVKITVEVRIPSGTPNGTYNTSWGIRSN